MGRKARSHSGKLQLKKQSPLLSQVLKKIKTPGASKLFDRENILSMINNFMKNPILDFYNQKIEELDIDTKTILTLIRFGQMSKILNIQDIQNLLDPLDYEILMEYSKPIIEQIFDNLGRDPEIIECIKTCQSLLYFFIPLFIYNKTDHNRYPYIDEKQLSNIANNNWSLLLFDSLELGELFNCIDILENYTIVIENLYKKNFRKILNILEPVLKLTTYSTSNNFTHQINPNNPWIYDINIYDLRLHMKEKIKRRPKKSPSKKRINRTF